MYNNISYMINTKKQLRTNIPSIILLVISLHLAYAQYISATITPSSYVIEETNTYQLRLTRNINPISFDFISPVASVPIDSTIEFIFPDEYTTISADTNLICSSPDTSETLICTLFPAANKIVIQGYFSTSETQTLSNVLISIEGIINPLRAGMTGNFEYYIKRSDGSIVDQSPSANYAGYSTGITFLGGEFTSCSISANSNHILTSSKLTFNLQPKHTIPSSGKLIIDFPSFWTSDPDSSSTFSSVSPTCSNLVNIPGISSCTFTNIPSPININRLTVSFTAQSSISSSFSFDVASILTPPYINYPTQIQIQSQWADGTTIDQCSSPISDLAPIPFKSISFASTDQTTVQSIFQGRIQVQINKAFYYQDQIKFQLPSNFINGGSLTVSSSNFPTFITDIDQLSSTVTLSSFGGSLQTLPANNVLTFFFQNAKNYQSVQPQSLTVTFLRSGEQYQQSSTSYTATQGTIGSFSITSDNTAVNKNGPATIELDTSLTFPIGSYIEIVYHSSISVVNAISTAVTSASIKGIVINGVTFSVNSNTITVFNLFNTTVGNGLISLILPSFINPPSIKPLNYLISVKSSNGYRIASSSYTFTATLQPMISNSITSSSYLVMDDDSVTYTLNFQTNFGFKAISILIPTDIQVSDGYDSTCSPNSYSQCILSTATDGSGKLNLTFIGTVTSGGSQSVSWGSNINPNSLRPTGSFSLQTYTAGFGVERSISSPAMVLTMTTVAELESSIIIPSSFKNNDVIDIEITYILPARSPSGTITITVPSVLDISNADCNLSCSIIPPRITLPFTNSDTSSPHSISILLSDVVNAPSYKPIGDFAISLKSSTNYNSISDSISGWTNTALSTFTTSVSSTDGFLSENVVFTFRLGGLSGKQKYANIKINNLFPALTSNPFGGSLISEYQVQFDVSGESSVQLSMTLVAPQTRNPSGFTFTVRTYTEDLYSIGSSISNVWNIQCVQTQCRDCHANLSCINCYDQSISEYYIFSTDQNTCLRECDPGNYKTTDDLCIPCNSNCAQCTNTPTTCTACQSGWFLDTVFDVCVETCSPTYYANSLNGQCMQCIGSCNQCVSDIRCINCKINFYLLDEECLADCPADIMVKDQVNRQCVVCDQNCKTCVTFPQRCTSCDTDQGLALENNQCVLQCADNFYKVDGVCTECQLPCRQCLDDYETCGSCFANQTLSLWYDNKCISPSQCGIGHFVNSVNGSCDACPDQCTNCISLTNCSACAEGFFLFSFKCLTVCPNTTYENDQTNTCDGCLNSGCETCQLNDTDVVCSSCDASEYLYAFECFVTCPSDTYGKREYDSNNILLQGICIDCKGECATCLNDTYCLTCKGETLLYRGQCLIECPSDTFENGLVCTKCPTHCTTCTSLTDCDTCVEGYSLQNTVDCVLNCQKGESFDQVCYPCGLNCSNCLDETCLRCQSETYLLDGRCYEDCPETTLIVNGSRCQLCSYKFLNCTTCTQAECLSCNDGQLVDGECQPCSQGYYSRNSQCVLCPSSCKSCENITFCFECADNFFKKNDFCYSDCPDNMYPNGLNCQFCQDGCSVCNRQIQGQCSICVAGMYQEGGECMSQCPDGMKINLNMTLCLTPQQYALEYSKASRKIYFPFTIASVIAIVIGVILKCYQKTMHLATFLISIVAWMELASWVLFGYIEYLFFTNQQTHAFKGILCIIVALVTLIIINIIFLKFYYKYISTDMDFIKWVAKHSCINGVFVTLGTILCFKFHRLIYSRVMDREQLSMILSSPKKLIPISVISVISIFLCSIPAGVGASLALYHSLSVDQQFIAALDLLVVTGIILILLLLDLKHPHNYFIDELETQNIKRKIYQQQDEKFDFENKINQQKQDGANVSRQNLIQEDENQNDLDYVQTAKKFNKAGNRKLRSAGDDPSYQTLRRGRSTMKQQSQVKGEPNEQPSIQDISQASDQVLMDNKKKWMAKQYDHHGYKIKYDENNNPIKYDQYGNRVEIDEQGNHHKYDEDGYQVKTNEDGEHVRYDANGFIVGSNGERYDSRGLKVNKNQETGQITYEDQHGYKVVQNQETGQLQKFDQDGNLVIIDPNTGEHKKYNEDGYLLKKGPKGDMLFYDEKEGQYVRKNEKGIWEAYDPKDGYILRKNQKGEYEKVDEHGFLVQKDDYGNVYLFDSEGNRVVIDKSDGSIKRYDKDGYEIRKDPVTGQIRRYDADGFLVTKDQNGNKVLYDEHGYRVEKDFYGNVTRYNQNGDIVVIDPNTNKHHVYNSEGLEIIKDSDGNTYLMDKRGNRVVDIDDDYYEKYDKDGNKVWLDEEGCQVQVDENGNTVRYDKIGDKVEQDSDEEGIEWEVDEQGGDAAMVGVIGGDNKKKKASRGFKKPKQFNYEEQYKKMLDQDTPHLIFDYGEESGQQDDLKEFHNIEPVQEKELQKEYRTLYQREIEGQMQKSNADQMKLEDLSEVDNTPYVNLKEKNKRSGTQGTEDKIEENKQTIDPQQKHQTHEIKSVADISINERSFENEGVQPISVRSDSQQDDLESLDEVQLNNRMMKKGNKKGGRSEMSLEQGGDVGQTKSENNFMKTSKNVEVEIKNVQNRNIYDSDEQVQSLGEEDWENQNEPDLFYKDNQNSNANKNTNDNRTDLDDQEDVLSDYLQEKQSHRHKASEQNLMRNRYMQSIEEVQDELFDKLKSEDRRVKRTEFRLSGTPNPLLQYAKKIDQRHSSKDRYPVTRR